MGKSRGIQRGFGGAERLLREKGPATLLILARGIWEECGRLGKVCPTTGKKVPGQFLRRLSQTLPQGLSSGPWDSEFLRSPSQQCLA